VPDYVLGDRCSISGRSRDSPVRFKILEAVTLKTAVFLDATLHNLANRYQHFRRDELTDSIFADTEDGGNRLLRSKAQ
jgi:hypothetical protein